MRKRCTCGETEFYVEVRDYDAYARASNETNLVEEVSKIVCCSCGSEYRY